MADVAAAGSCCCCVGGGRPNRLLPIWNPKLNVTDKTTVANCAGSALSAWRWKCRCPPLWWCRRPWDCRGSPLSGVWPSPDGGCHGPLELVVVLLQIMKLYAISRRSVETVSRTAKAWVIRRWCEYLEIMRRSSSMTMQPSCLPVANLLPRTMR